MHMTKRAYDHLGHACACTIHARRSRASFLSSGAATQAKDSYHYPPWSHQKKPPKARRSHSRLHHREKA